MYIRPSQQGLLRGIIIDQIIYCIDMEVVGSSDRLPKWTEHLLFRRELTHLDRRVEV